jgi:hypothetical protein
MTELRPGCRRAYWRRAKEIARYVLLEAASRCQGRKPPIEVTEKPYSLHPDWTGRISLILLDKLAFSVMRFPGHQNRAIAIDRD